MPRPNKPLTLKGAITMATELTRFRSQLLLDERFTNEQIEGAFKHIDALLAMLKPVMRRGS